MRSLIGWIRYRSLTWWLVLIGLLYAALAIPLGWDIRLESGLPCYSVGCWWEDRVVQPLLDAGQYLLVALVLFPPGYLSHVTADLLRLHPLLSLVTVPLYTVPLTVLIGRLIAGIWRRFRSTKSPVMKWTVAILTSGVVALYASYSLSAVPREYKVVPTAIELHFTLTLTPAGRVPAVRLLAYVDEVCGRASRLGVRVPERAKRIILDIDGFTLRTAPWMCNSNNFATSYAAVSLDGQWLRRGKGDLVIMVAGRKNHFELVRSGYRVTLIPQHAPNIRLIPPTYPGARKPEDGTVSEFLFPPDIAVLVGRDRGILEMVAREEGWPLADVAYPGLVQDRLGGLLVVVKGSVPNYQRLRGPQGEPYDPAKHQFSHIALIRVPNVPSKDLVR